MSTTNPQALGPKMDEELNSQPETWRRAIQMDEERKQLPEKGARIAVIGCGTSWFIAQAYAALREAHGHGEADAFTPTEFPKDRTYDAYLVITRSGTTTEVLDFLRNLPEGATSVAITGVPESPVTELATRSVLLPFADEESVVQTRFATTALMFLRAGIESKDVCLAAADQAEKALAAAPEDELVNAEQYSFLGRGWTLGLATEAGLKMRESCQAWTESYSAMEYRHGPIAIAAPGRVTWIFGEAPEGLTEQVKSTGAHFENSELDPMADLARLHAVALATARARELNPDNPRNLTRSVILK